MKVFFITILVFYAHLTIYSQEMLGIVNSNYSGIYGISLNPANMVGSRLYMDYNLLSFQSSFVNNYSYVERNDYLNYLFHGTVPIYYTEDNEERNYTIYRSDNNYYGYFNQKLIGPAAMIVDGKHAYGITTALRSNTSFQNLPNEIGVFLYEAIDYTEQQGITYNHEKDIQVGSLAWFEVNFSYAYNFRRYRWESWSAGITMKPLLGMLGTYTNIYNLQYQVHNDDSASVYNSSFDYAYSLPVDYNDNHFPQNPLVKGFGIGVDLGVTYTKTTKGHSTKYYGRLCEQRYDAYNYKIGVSFLDIGYINFTKNAQQTSYINTHTEWFKPYDTLPVNSVNEINAKVDSYFLDNSEEVTRNEKFTMHIPPAMSMQYDYSIKDYLFINATIIWGFNFGKAYVKRPSILAITPRFETARVEVSLPISIYEWNWKNPRIGFSLRYGNFFFGFDKINTILGFSDFNGFDLYAGLRLNLTNNFKMNYIKGLCGNKKLRNIEMFDYRNF